MSVKPIATWGKRWKLPIVRHFHNRFRAHSSNWASNRVTQMESVLLRLIYDVVCTCVGQQSKVGCNTLPMLLSRYLKERLPQIVAFRETAEKERIFKFFFLLIFFYVCSQSKKTQQFTRGRAASKCQSLIKSTLYSNCQEKLNCIFLKQTHSLKITSDAIQLQIRTLPH